MRTTLELVDQDLIFTQQSLLTPSEFMDKAKERNVAFLSLGDGQLEALHRVGVLIPLYRVKKNVRAIKETAGRENLPLSLLLRRVSRGVKHLRIARESGELFDPRQEPYQPWQRYVLKIDNTSIRTSEFLYSPYQLLLLPYLHSLLSEMEPSKVKPLSYGFNLILRNGEASHVQTLREEYDDLAIALSILEPIYRPRITTWITGNFEQWQQFEKAFDIVRAMNWIGWSPQQILENAERLISVADGLDPLVGWIELVRLCRPRKWETLQGDALMAMDHRIAAEMLFHFYEDLVKVRAAPPLEPIPPLAPHPRHHRLTPNREELDAVLMKFELSPHPSLVLFVEGETELMIVPRVMELLEISTRRSFIELHLTGGYSADIGRLAMLVARPNIRQSQEDLLLFTRPPTHFFFVVDHEGPFKEPEQIREKKQEWVTRIAQTIQFTHHLDVSQEDLKQLVEVATWGEGGSFEFAHFSNQEIVEGIENACRSLGITPTRQLLEEEVEGSRRNESAQNVEYLWRSGKLGRDARRKLSKLHLAIALWPTLEAKIRKGIEEGSLDTIPVVRVLQQAVEIAVRVHRSDVMIRKADDT